MVPQCCVKIIRGGQQQQRMTLHTRRHANGRQSFTKLQKKNLASCINCTSPTCFTRNGFSQRVKNNTIIYPAHHKEQVSLISLQWCWSFFFFTGWQNTDVNCGYDWRIWTLIMRCLHSDIWFLWRRPHSVVARPQFMIRHQLLCVSLSKEPAGGEPNYRT